MAQEAKLRHFTRALQKKQPPGPTQDCSNLAPTPRKCCCAQLTTPRRSHKSPPPTNNPFTAPAVASAAYIPHQWSGRARVFASAFGELGGERKQRCERSPSCHLTRQGIALLRLKPKATAAELHQYLHDDKSLQPAVLAPMLTHSLCSAVMDTVRPGPPPRRRPPPPAKPSVSSRTENTSCIM